MATNGERRKRESGQIALDFDAPVPEDICAARHGGNAESLAAHASLLPRLAQMQTDILAEIKRRGTATCDEVEGALGLAHQTASARIAELKRDSLIVPTGERRATRRGRAAMIYRVAASEAICHAR
jgi:predicted transcriptional regulator